MIGLHDDWTAWWEDCVMVGLHNDTRTDEHRHYTDDFAMTDENRHCADDFAMTDEDRHCTDDCCTSHYFV